MRQSLKFLAFAGVMLLAACAERGTFSSAAVERAGQSVERVHYATLRQRVQGRQLFNNSRARGLSFGYIDVSIPPSHETGQIEWPGQVPDPDRHFVVAGQGRLQGLDELAGRVRGGEQPIVLFVHGYNNNFAEAIYRHAQIAHDHQAPGTHIQFSWPSRASPTGYLYDRDSVIYSRDSLVLVISALTRTRPGEVVVVGHSMGAYLVMEALRQMALTGQGRSLRALADVVLVSPDIDEDVFVRQMEQVRPRPDELLVVVNTGDRLLRIAGRIAGEEPRLGLGVSKDRMSALGVTVIDLSGVPGGDRPGHFLPATSPAAIAFLRSLRDLDEQDRAAAGSRGF